MSTQQLGQPLASGIGPWVLQRNSAKEGRTYLRPLGTVERCYYLDSQRLHGATDTLHRIIVEVHDQCRQPEEVFSPVNVRRAWIMMKRRFPLLGAHVQQEDGDGRNVCFVVNDADLERLSPGEVVFGHTHSGKDVEEFMDTLLNGERPLSNQLLIRLFIFAESEHRYHIIIYSAHCVSDGVAIYSLTRNLLEEIASPSNGKLWKLEQRLALAIPQDGLMSTARFTLPKQRWRLAIAKVICSLRSQKSVGGHTLPRTYTRLTKRTPATSAEIRRTLTLDESLIIIENSRSMGLSFGNVFPVIAQVALARLLCRRYLRGEISAEEWEFRKREPMTTVGPLSSRPFLDKQWYKQGGAINFCLAVGAFSCTLPFMPLGTASRLAPGEEVPGYKDFLSLGRFVLRSKMVQKQMEKQSRHPLFLDIGSAVISRRTDSFPKIESRRPKALFPDDRDAVPISVMDESRNGSVLTHGGASLGAIDTITPLVYNSKNGKIQVIDLWSILRCRPDQLYLGSVTFNKKLDIGLVWDKNVYDEVTIGEWLDEMVEAVRHYLMARGVRSRL